MSDDLPDGFDQNMDEVERRYGVEIRDYVLQALKNGEMTPAMISYLLNHYGQFLRVKKAGQPDLDSSANDEVQLIRAETGWTIRQYGDHTLASSAGELLLADGDYLAKENPGQGTIIKQAFDTGGAMARVIKQLGWPSAELIDGHDIMIRGLWVMLRKLGIVLENFDPNALDQEVENRLRSDSRGPSGRKPSPS